MRARTMASARCGRRRLAPRAATECQETGAVATDAVSRPGSRSASSTQAAVGTTGVGRPAAVRA